jgi:hypothetical protein
MLAFLAILPPLLVAPSLQKPAASKPWDATNGPQPEDVLAGGDEKMHYLLHAPDKDAKEPTGGWQ